MFPTEHFPDVRCFYVRCGYIFSFIDFLEEPIQDSKIIPGTRSHHFFRPTADITNVSFLWR